MLLPPANQNGDCSILFGTPPIASWPTKSTTKAAPLRYLNMKPFVVATFLILGIAPIQTLEVGRAQEATFIHPGVTHTQASIDFVKGKIASGEEPWTSAWKGLQASRHASLDWRPQARAHVERGASNDPDIGSSEFSNDGIAAYHHALLWALNGKELHAKKAAEILNAWSGKLETISNHDARLLIGMDGYEYCDAAELLKHTWDGWPKTEQQQFAKMLRTVFYPVIKDFYPSANGNWDASMLQTMLAMGVHLDDRAMFDRGVDYYLNGKGNGAVRNYFKPSGQCQETGRDQAHTQMGLDFLACTCEIAWNQGQDLYKAYDNRLLRGFEYTAKYNLGFDVPYEPYRSFEGRYHYKSISDNSRGRLRPMYEKVLNHYTNRKTLKADFTSQAVMKLREDSKRIVPRNDEARNDEARNDEARDDESRSDEARKDESRDKVRDDKSRRRRRSRRSRSSALGTLMFSGQSADALRSQAITNKPTVICFGDSITNRGYYNILSKLLDVEAVNAGVGGNSTAKALRRLSSDVLDKAPDFVVVLFGTNDLRADAEKVFVPLEKYRANLSTIVDRCQEGGAAVVLCTLPPIDHDAFFTRHERAAFDAHGGLTKMIDSYRDTARDVAKDQGVPLVDLNALLAKEPQWISKDGVHPSEKGTAIIAKHVADALAPLLTK